MCREWRKETAESISDTVLAVREEERWMIVN
jgi:hypothetical protein